MKTAWVIGWITPVQIAIVLIAIVLATSSVSSAETMGQWTHTDPEGSVCLVEVDLNRRPYWYWMGNLKNEIRRTRPPAIFPK